MRNSQLALLDQRHERLGDHDGIAVFRNRFALPADPLRERLVGDIGAEGFAQRRQFAKYASTAATSFAFVPNMPPLSPRAPRPASAVHDGAVICDLSSIATRTRLHRSPCFPILTSGSRATVREPFPHMRDGRRRSSEVWVNLLDLRWFARPETFERNGRTMQTPVGVRFSHPTQPAVGVARGETGCSLLRSRRQTTTGIPWERRRRSGRMAYAPGIHHGQSAACVSHGTNTQER